MPYVKPKDVTSPKKYLSDVVPVYDGGPDGVSIATLKWDGYEHYGIRWNMSIDGSLKGVPVSTGYPVWFIVPSDMNKYLEEYIKDKDGGK